MNHIQFLTKLGLSEKESSVYLALLTHGALGVSDIARHTALYRTDVYTALRSLEEDALVSLTQKGKQKRYLAQPPSILEAKFVELANSFDDTLAELSALKQRVSPDEPHVHYASGKKAIRALYDDVVESLDKGETYYRYSSAKVEGVDKRGDYLSKKYRLLRDKKGIERKVITNAKNMASKRPRLERDIKAVPPDFDLFEYNISEIIYRDKVAVIDYNQETVVTIDNPVVAKFQKRIFELLFKKL